MRLCYLLMVILGCMASLGGCAHIDASGPTRATDAFIAAIQDAAVPQDFEVSHDLIAIGEDNPRITWRDSSKRQLLVVTWKSREAYQRYLEPERNTSPNEQHVLWVTVVPQVKEFCRTLGLAGGALSQRIKQYLGLAPARDYHVFVELWVGRDDLFRPCPDPETDDTQCNLSFEGSPDVPRIDDYKDFFTSLYYTSYRVEGAPWTRLGYTYDWGGEGEEGASEFVVAPDSPYEIKAVYTTEEYCAL